MTKRTHRIATVVLAPVAALLGWGLIRLIGIDLDVSTGDGIVGPGDIVVAALAGALGGWLVVRWLERHTYHPLAWWGFIGSTSLSVSTIGPSYFADGASLGGLLALHFLVAIVVITALATPLPVPCCPPTHPSRGRDDPGSCRPGPRPALPDRADLGPRLELRFRGAEGGDCSR